MARRALDRWPNYMGEQLQLSSANTFTTAAVPLPVVRPSAGRGRSTIMEFLWIDLEIAAIDLIADNDSCTFTLSTGAPPTTVGTLDDGNILMLVRLEAQVGAATGVDIRKFPIRYRWQDAGGFGLLVATDRINMNGISVGQAGSCVFSWKLYYRYVDVSAEEYIGIVQSQMSG